MSRATTRAMFILLGGAMPAWQPPPPTGECDPYTKPHHLSANINLNDALVRVSHTAANVNICEDMT